MEYFDAWLNAAMGLTIDAKNREAEEPRLILPLDRKQPFQNLGDVHGSVT